MKILITFGVKYNREEETHPVFPDITGDHYMLFEGENWREARLAAETVLGQAFAFDYPYEDENGVTDLNTHRMIKKWGMKQFVPAEKEEADV